MLSLLIKQHVGTYMGSFSLTFRRKVVYKTVLFPTVTKEEPDYILRIQYFKFHKHNIENKNLKAIYLLYLSL